MSKSSRFTAWVVWILTLVAVDKISKIWVIKMILLGSTLPLLPHVNLTQVHNSGAAFSWLSQASGWQYYLLVTVAFLSCMVLSCWLLKTKSNFTKFALSCIIAGALGNLWDRLQYGIVVDFIDFYVGQWHWYTFNLADSFICVGVILLLFSRSEP